MCPPVSYRPCLRAGLCIRCTSPTVREGGMRCLQTQALRSCTAPAKAQACAPGLQNFFHPANAFGHLFFGVAERDPQEAFGLVPERNPRHRDDPVLQTPFRNLDVITE